MPLTDDIVLRTAGRRLIEGETCHVCGKKHAPTVESLLAAWARDEDTCGCDCCELTPDEVRELRERSASS